MHAGMALCGGLMIGVDIQGAEHAAVGNGEVTAGQVIYGQLAVAAFHCQLFNILFDIRRPAGRRHAEPG